MKQVKLSTKLVGGFGLVALITLVVGFTGWKSTTDIAGHLATIADQNLPSIRSLLTFERGATSVRVAMRTLLNPGLGPRDRERQHENVKRAREEYTKAWKQYEALPHSREDEALWKQFVPAWEAFRDENTKFFQLVAELEKTAILEPEELMKQLETFGQGHYKLLTNISKAILMKMDFEGGEDPTQCAFGKWLTTYQSANPVVAEALKSAVPPHNAVHGAVKKIKEMLKKGEVEEMVTEFAKEMVPQSEALMNHFATIKAEATKADDLYRKMNEQALVHSYAKQSQALPILTKLIELSEKEAEEEQASGEAVARIAQRVSLAGMAIGSVIALALGIVLSISITRPVNRIIEGLIDGAHQVVCAAGEVASASQSLAEGTSQQAAAVEQVSSSMEELSSMTRQNADSSNQANVCMTETAAIVQEATISMSDLTTSMEEISQASEATHKIVKTIDEIAFQTNLLALNAAVEAARAGEAGAGFAVVADEVRNLAMRAAEAAKNTAELIEGTVKRVKAGAETVSKASRGFSDVAGGARKAGDLVGEIAAATGEQAQGISQINQAMSEVDKVTQQNAAAAEECAAAAEEMSSQAESMKSYASELLVLVRGQELEPTVSPQEERASRSSVKVTHPARKLLNGAGQ